MECSMVVGRISVVQLMMNLTLDITGAGNGSKQVETLIC